MNSAVSHPTLLACCGCRRIETKMRTTFLLLVIVVGLFAAIASAQSVYAGFDKNDYPGDAAMISLRKTFRYTSYWLNNPPGSIHNPWSGKRSFIRQQGFGFLLFLMADSVMSSRAKMLQCLAVPTAMPQLMPRCRKGFQ